MVEEIPRFLLQEFKYEDEEKKYGGEAWVVKGTHPRLTGDVAIRAWTKTFNNNELKLLTKRINHENIIQLLGLLIDKQSRCIGYIMPYMDRGNFDDVIYNTERNHNDVYTSEQVTSWITQICLGLSYLHSNNIIHRDIKPSNILLGQSLNDLKLADFGMIRSLDDLRSLTKEAGTLMYMAPEMSETANYNSSVDIYSLSITIWEILHRRIPFDHVTTNRRELSTKIIHGERPELGSDLSKEVSDLLEKCWHVQVSHRPTIYDVLEFSKNSRFQVPQKETILLLGGTGGSKLLDSLLILQNNGTNKENWKSTNVKLPYPISNHGAQFLKNNLYIFGGENKKDETLNSTYKLSNTLKWEQMADMNQKRSFIINSNVLLNDRIWVIGGLNGKEKLKSVEMYDPLRNEWKYMKEMNECRVAAAATVMNGKIFCCGGYNGENILDSVECYDPSSDVWTFVSPMPLPLCGLGAVAVDGNLITIGGMNKTEDFKNVWKLNTLHKNAFWIENPSMSHPRSFLNITKIDNKILVYSGPSFTGWTISCMEMFDGEVWRQGPNPKNTRAFAACTVIPINFGKYLEYGITRFGCTTVKSNATYAHGTNQTLTINDINLEKETILLLGGFDGKKVLR